MQLPGVTTPDGETVVPLHTSTYPAMLRLETTISRGPGLSRSCTWICRTVPECVAVTHGPLRVGRGSAGWSLSQAARTINATSRSKRGMEAAVGESRRTGRYLRWIVALARPVCAPPG